MFFCFLVLLFLFTAVKSDIPVHCLLSQAYGDWVFWLTPNTQSSDYTCSETVPDKADMDSYEVTLSRPNVATDSNGNVGTFTLFYDQGFEIRIDGMKYFAYFDYTGTDEITSYCNRTLPGRGTYHEDATILPESWGCLYGERSDNGESNTHTYTADLKDYYKNQHMRKRPRISGGKQDKFVPLETEDKSFRNNYPYEFDWRNVSGVDYVGDIRDQLSCGSCYSFAAVQAMESRFRIWSGMETDIFLGAQTVVSCCPYSEGCDGGFGFSVGKFAQDYGIYELRSFAYMWDDAIPCSWQSPDAEEHVHYMEDYYYIGGYFGNCSEEAMMQEIYEKGPIAVSISCADSFSDYKEGVYYEPPVELDGGFIQTDHCVAVVGWGYEDDGTAYWIVRNSWGRHWGETGYMKMQRGVNSAGIESMAVGYTPYLG
eukprot:gnl/Chilomastix_cuspidata/218.p1 GENE.gnl/Chilomastix_cuspidata/218~~gnl/Chilomastix_cuspidata/218.p1  ORF type:complete len:426 (+),score=36.55 gnl/Chilomastix_cuspidata/218:30-1307(+)